MRYNLAGALLVCTSIFTNCFAQTKESQIPDSLLHKTTFQYENNGFKGEGWNILKSEIGKAQIVLIGEQHGEAEIPVFTMKVADVFKPKALVVEIDPYTATRLKTVCTDTAGYSNYFKQNPYDFAFYSYQTEMELARQMTLAHIDIWGLNEINFISMASFFNTLAVNAKSPANKKLALSKAKECADNDLPIYKHVDRYNDFIAYRLKTSMVDSLLVTFKGESNECQKMLRDLKASIPIFANTSYQARTAMMKKNLLNYVSPYITKDSIAIPRLLFKFGANHVSRTNDLKGFFEAGNLADNLAEASGGESLHILIFGKSGTSNQMAPVDNTLAIQPYDVSKDTDLDMFTPFYSQVQGNEWALYDLRPIREAINDGRIKVRADLRGFIMAYDLLVLFGHVTGNKFIE